MFFCGRFGLGFRFRFGLGFGLGLRFGLGLGLGFRLRLGFRLGFGLRLGLGFGLGFGLGLRLRFGLGLRLRFGLGLGLGFRLRLGFRFGHGLGFWLGFGGSCCRFLPLLFFVDGVQHDHGNGKRNDENENDCKNDREDEVLAHIVEKCRADCIQKGCRHGLSSHDGYFFVFLL